MVVIIILAHWLKLPIQFKEMWGNLGGWWVSAIGNFLLSVLFNIRKHSFDIFITFLLNWKGTVWPNRVDDLIHAYTQQLVKMCFELGVMGEIRDVETTKGSALDRFRL